MKLKLIDTRCWFTSDHHFGHEKLLEYLPETRGKYDTVGDMDDDLVAKWNDVVEPDDFVFHLGDFTLEGRERAHDYLSRLNGQILILGNRDHHDKGWLPATIHLGTKNGTLDIIPPLATVEFEHRGQVIPIVLCHFPLEVWDRKHYDSIHLHGHIHVSRDEPSPYKKNVGVDYWNGFPVSLETAIKGTKYDAS